MKRISISTRSAMVGFVFACSLSQAAAVIGPNTTITFETGKDALTHESEIKIRDLVKHARQTGKIDKVKVAVWSDNPAPREGQELSSVDQKLADDRVKTIENCLKRHKISGIETYNMAERANWLARFLNNDEADFKSETGKGNQSPLFKEEFQIFKTNGDSSKAVIITTLVKHRSMGALGE